MLDKQNTVKVLKWPYPVVCRVQELEEDLETTETKYTIAMQKYEKVMHFSTI
jgi:hypothetical protein